jgi:hypothetical protein
MGPKQPKRISPFGSELTAVSRKDLDDEGFFISVRTRIMPACRNAWLC